MTLNELYLKAKEAKTAEELLAMAKENGVELCEAMAKSYFEQLHKSGELSDDELDNVSGGGCETSVSGKEYTIVTARKECFTGQWDDNLKLDGTYHRTDNQDLRDLWRKMPTNVAYICGRCRWLGFKSGTGYCEKS